MFSYFILKDGLVASFVTPTGQEKYTFLICSYDKHLHFEEKKPEKS